MLTPIPHSYACPGWKQIPPPSDSSYSGVRVYGVEEDICETINKKRKVLIREQELL